ncbi:NAD+ kinase [Leptospira sp. GIMC2001]|uniref:NAD+ kinase n=1 Tax=Leptospira sp. GIMC2001 TaxID=1513297 RepID=UPI002349FCF0|nr:NAD+ kinase [Leptospira sp. GIMC2001]WCL50281.1 NAD+ kinase [Leptospira sp. GIMC2001]
MFDKIVIVTRSTRLEESIRKFNTKGQAKFYVTNRGQSFEDYELEYDNYSKAKEQVIRAIDPGIKYHLIDRSYLTNYVFGPNDLVLTLGQDGLVVNTAKYLTGQPIFAVNPDPARFDGVLLPFTTDDIQTNLSRVFEAQPSFHDITMAQVQLGDNQKLYAFNDFFIGPKSQSSARYTIHYRSESERQISSGIIVSTPAGSTGWFSSVFNMANGMNRFANSEIQLTLTQMSWSDKRLLFAVREPFMSQWSKADIVAGTVDSGEELVLESHMPENGVIFSDGMETDFLEFTTGTTAKIKLADKITKLIAASQKG